MEFLRDSIWQFIGVVVAIIFPLILLIFQRNRKDLSYEIVSNVPIVSVGKEISHRVQVLLENRLVTNVNLVILKLQNSGNVSIRTEDFDQDSPIIFNFGKNIEILEADLLETKPKAIINRVKVRLTKKELILMPLLLNKKDEIKFKLLIKDYKGFLNIDSSIDGIKQINRYENTADHIVNLFFFIYSVLLLPLFVWFHYYTSSNLKDLRDGLQMMIFIYIIFSLLLFFTTKGMRQSIAFVIKKLIH
jgi:hypothetical protein